MKLMAVKKAEAVYTGGGVYTYMGELASGEFFLTADEWDFAVLILDADPSADLEASGHEEWQNAHLIREVTERDALRFWDEMLQMIHDFDGYDYEHRLETLKYHMKEMGMMKKEYEVTLRFTQNGTITIEAENEEEAVELAHETDADQFDFDDATFDTELVLVRTFGEEDAHEDEEQTLLEVTQSLWKEVGNIKCRLFVDTPEVAYRYGHDGADGFRVYFGGMDGRISDIPIYLGGEVVKRYIAYGNKCEIHI